MTRLLILTEAVEKRLPLLYFAWAMLAGSLVAYVMPAWQNADEGAHVRRAAEIAQGELLARRLSPVVAGGVCDPAIAASEGALASVTAHPMALIHAAALGEAAKVRWGRPTLCTFSNTATYPPFLYVAAALGAAIGRLGHMHVAATLQLMRMMNVVVAGAVGSAALAAARRTRLVLAFTMLLPMSLALSASAGQDALLLPLATWAVACIDRARCEGLTVLGPGRAAAIAAALLLVSLGRPPYVSLALLMLALPTVWWPARAGLAAIVVAGTLAWAAYVAWEVSVPLSVADPARQGAFLLHHPLALVASVWSTVVSWGNDYLREAVGVLGWLDTPLPGHFIRAVQRGFVVVLLSAAVPDAAPGGPWWHSRTTLGLLAWAGGTLAVFVALYMIWSPPGAAFVYGIQGRYFLPLIPPLTLATPNLGRWAVWIRPPALIAVLLLGAIGPVVTITTLVDRYYLQP